ncbi:MAG TPA: FtsX-like permease family protein [Candidatus Acidoferrales bacterium]|nr:FtsX-like permease family protein [Candidatus Acidoferrales bacterium]
MTLGTWLRSWRRTPFFTAQFSLTISIGMGAASALTSLMLALGFQPLPFRDPGRLVVMWQRPQSGTNILAVSGPDLADFADATHGIFTSFSAFTFGRQFLLDRSGTTEIRAPFIQASAFSDLGIRPVLGRGVLPDDEPLNGGGTPPAWISYRLWKTRYSGSPSVIGTTIGIAATAQGLYEYHERIVGVLPQGVNIPLPLSWTDSTDVLDVLFPDTAAKNRQSDMFFGLGRLRPGVTVEQAQAALTVVAERLGKLYSFDAHRLPMVESLEEIAQGPVRKTMGLLALGVGLVFFVGCVNLAILMGAEGRRRRREIAIRAVLGANRSRLWREAAGEKCLLALLSLALGVWFAWALLRVLTQLMPAAGLGPPLAQPPPLNLAVLFGFVAFVLISALVWSALLVAAADGPRSSLALASSGGVGYAGFSDSGPGAGRWRLILLAAQVGTGICLLAAAAVAVSTYAKLSAANLGPDPRHTVLISVDTRDNVFLNDAQSVEFSREVQTRLERLPGTQAIALAARFPPIVDPAAFMKQGDAVGTIREGNYPTSVSPDYFRTLGIRILYGRGFNDADNNASEPLAIVSLEIAKQNWPSPEQAVGSWFAFAPKYQTHYNIVGVAADFTGFWSQVPTPTIYLSEQWDCCGAVILRTTASPQAVAALAPQALQGMAIPAVVSDISTMEAWWQKTVTRPVARMAGMILLAMLGLALSVQGVYAVAAATVSARTHELAVRSALGAPPGRLAWNVTQELVLAVGLGSVCGVAAALALRRLLEQWLGPLASSQAVPIAAAVVLLALAAAAGCYIPARAAARANPADILRQG